MVWNKVERVIKAHHLHHFPVNPLGPSRSFTKDDRNLGEIMRAYLTWEQQD